MVSGGSLFKTQGAEMVRGADAITFQFLSHILFIDRSLKK